MNRAWWLLFAIVVLSVWNAGIIWFTQIAVYPLWPLVGSSQFHDYHLTWWHHVWPTFTPVALMLACSIFLLRVRPAGISKTLLVSGIVLQGAVHLLTIFFWAPVQASMATPTGISMMKYQELMATHWWRVSFFCGYALLAIYMFARFNQAARGQGPTQQ